MSSNPPNYRDATDYAKSCANCKCSQFGRNGKELRCTLYDFSFGNTDECDPQDNASESVCDSFKR